MQKEVPPITTMSTVSEDETLPQEEKSKKSVRFSSDVVSDTFYVERLDPWAIRQLFYTESEVIGFQIDALRSGERKQRKRRPQGLKRGNSDGAVASKRRDSSSDESSSSSSSKKKSSRSKSSSKKTKSRSSRRRYSNDDAHDYEPRDKESSKRSSRTKNKTKSSKTKSKQPKDEMTRESPEQLMVEQDDTDRQAPTRTLGLEDNRLDSTGNQPNISLDPWTQDMLMAKAKQWHNAVKWKTQGTTIDEKATAKDDGDEKEISKKGDEALEKAFSALLSTKKKQAPSNITEQSPSEEVEDDDGASSSGSSDLDSDDDEPSSESSVDLMDLIEEKEKPTTQEDLLLEAMQKRKSQQETQPSLVSRWRGFTMGLMVAQKFQSDTRSESSTESTSLG